MATIVVADDDPVSQRILGHIIRRLGHEVVSAANGREALEHVRRQRPDLVILDLAMPEMDGLTALRHIRDEEGPRRLPVIMLTASGLDRDERAARAGGADDYLTKPCRSQELIDKLQQLLGP
jgi:CheY-like chemotaxis protein